jgi:hypothetical protein
LRFCDLELSEHQQSWEDKIPPWNRPARELAFSREEHGKKIWSAYTRKRELFPECIIVTDSGYSDRRAQSVALAIGDTLRLPREAIGRISDLSCVLNADAKPENHFIYTLTKAARALVL